LAAIYEALDDGWTFEGGNDTNDNNNDGPTTTRVICESTTTIPLQAGCSSSSAFCVAFSLVLAQLATSVGGSSSLFPTDTTTTTTTTTSATIRPWVHYLLDHPIVLAQRAHRAEVTHFGAPGGTMDHVTSAVGGIVRIGGNDSGTKTNNPWHVTSLTSSSLQNHKNDLGCWVLAYSGQPKDTFQHLYRCKNARLALLHKLHGNWDAFTTTTTTTATEQEEEEEDTTSTRIQLTEDEQVLLSTTLINRDTERQAAALLWPQSGTPQPTTNAPTTTTSTTTTTTNLAEQLGQLMQQHHNALRDGLHLSTPVLETLGQAARNAGAYGFKVVGSGGGGCGVAWTSSDTDTVQRVAKAMETAGASQVWIIKSAGGGNPGARLYMS
jgi:mevalonate kinase